MSNFDVNRFEKSSEHSQELAIKKAMLKKIFSRIDYNLSPEDFTKLRNDIRNIKSLETKHKQKINRTIGDAYAKKNAYRITKEIIKLIDLDDDVELTDYVFEAMPYLERMKKDPYAEEFFIREIENYVINHLKNKGYGPKLFSTLYVLNSLGYCYKLERIEHALNNDEVDETDKFIFMQRYEKYLNNKIVSKQSDAGAGIFEAIDVNKFERGTEQSQEWEIKKQIIRKELDRIDFDFGPKFFIEHSRGLVTKATKKAFPDNPKLRFDNDHNKKIRKFQSKLEQVLCKKYYENNKERLLKIALSNKWDDHNELSYLTYFLTYMKNDNQYREKFISAFLKLLENQTYNFFNHKGNYAQAASARDSFFTNVAITLGWINELNYHEEIKRYIELVYDNTKGEINREFRNKLLRLHTEYMNNHLADGVTELTKYHNKIFESDSMSLDQVNSIIYKKMMKNAYEIIERNSRSMFDHIIQIAYYNYKDDAYDFDIENSIESALDEIIEDAELNGNKIEYKYYDYIRKIIANRIRGKNDLTESKDFDSMSQEEQEQEIKAKMIFRYLNEPTVNNVWTNENLFKDVKEKFGLRSFDTIRLFKKYDKQKELIDYIVRRLKETKGCTHSIGGYMPGDPYLNKHDFLLACMYLNQMNYGKRIPEIEFNISNDPIKQEYYDAMVGNRDVNSEVHKEI